MKVIIIIDHPVKKMLYLNWMFCLLLFLQLPLYAQTSLPEVCAGRVVRLEHFGSKYVQPRNVDVWLPQGYSDKEKYSVLYLHDGQMLFDSALTWNHQEWKADEVATQLMKEKVSLKFIIVGIWNSSEGRHADYFPQNPFELLLNETEQDTVTAQLIRSGRAKKTFKPCSDAYLKFMVEELKPHIDKTFSVYTDPAHTVVGGSSMGGLISWYAMCEYPEIFGGAICMSTHWPGTFTMADNPAPQSFLLYLTLHMPDPVNHKFYFDTGDRTLDALYPPVQNRVDHLLRGAGYDSRNWITKYYPGADHSERSWSQRLEVPLRFMFK